MMDSRFFLVVLLAAYASSAPAASPAVTVPSAAGPSEKTMAVDPVGETTTQNTEPNAATVTEEQATGPSEAASTDGPAEVSTQKAVTEKPATEATASTASIETAAQVTTGPTAPPTTEKKTTPTAGKTTTPPTTPAGTTKKVVTTESPATKAPSTQKFNAASFIGGIVLGIVIIAVLGFAYSFYRTRRDKNYHTL